MPRALLLLTQRIQHYDTYTSQRPYSRNCSMAPDFVTKFSQLGWGREITEHSACNDRCDSCRLEESGASK